MPLLLLLNTAVRASLLRCLLSQPPFTFIFILALAPPSVCCWLRVRTPVVAVHVTKVRFQRVPGCLLLELRVGKLLELVVLNRAIAIKVDRLEYSCDDGSWKHMK